MGEPGILSPMHRFSASPIPFFSMPVRLCGESCLGDQKPVRYLREIWNRWKQFSFRLGSMMGRVWLTLFYFTLLIPFVIVARLTANSFTHHETPEWQPVALPDDPQTAAKKQG